MPFLKAARFKTLLRRFKKLKKCCFHQFYGVNLYSFVGNFWREISHSCCERKIFLSSAADFKRMTDWMTNIDDNVYLTLKGWCD